MVKNPLVNAGDTDLIPEEDPTCLVATIESLQTLKMLNYVKHLVFVQYSV